jgi:hypothetical protein
MDIKNTIAEFKAAQTTVTLLTSELQVFVKSDAPIEQRWAAYLLIEGFLPSTSGFDLRGAEADMGCREMCYYDDIGIDRYQKITLGDIVEHLQDKVLEDVDEYHVAIAAYCKEHDIDYMFRTEESKAAEIEMQSRFGNKFLKFREAIMQSGFGSTDDDH